MKQWVGVNSARNNYLQAQTNLDKLITQKGDLQGEVNRAEYATDDNREQIRTSIIAAISAISIDPIDILSDIAAASIETVFNIADDTSLVLAEAKARKVLAKIENDIIPAYNTETTVREAYYRGQRDGYESMYGTFDPNAPPETMELSFCIRGDTCTDKIRDPDADPESHQVPCPDKIKGRIYGERNCTDHVYSCDPNYVCRHWNDHMIDSAGCEDDRYPRGEKDEHKLVANPPCNAAHSYYACNDDAHEFVKRGRCRSIKTFSSVYEYPWGYTGTRRVRCTNPSTYYKCTPHAHVYPRPSSSSY